MPATCQNLGILPREGQAGSLIPTHDDLVPIFMNNGSPTAYLLWAILACVFLIFLVVHLWSYDKFNCLRWNSGRQPGAFKRVMTYSYLGTVPLLVVFSIAMATAKVQEGYIVLPFSDGKIVPKLLSLWSPTHKQWLFPLAFTLSFGWALELVTHLEELTFWLFLLHQGPGKREWFHSWEFRIWLCGSIIAVLGMPLTAVMARHCIETTQAWIFLVGSSASTLTTIVFIYVLLRFPAFLQQVKDGGADPDVVVRLATFFNMNCLRVVFRFLFTVPLLLVAGDAIMPPFPIISGPFATDFLLMTGAIGCFVSSAITLLIFFPRSITREEGYRAKLDSPHQSDKVSISPLPEYIQNIHQDSIPERPHHRYVSSYDFDSTAYKAGLPHDYPPASPKSPVSGNLPLHLQSPQDFLPNPPPTSPSSYFPDQRDSLGFPNHLSDVDQGALGDEEETSEESSPEYESDIDYDESRLDFPATVQSSYMMHPLHHDPQQPQSLPSPTTENLDNGTEPSLSPPQTRPPHLRLGPHTLQPSNHDRLKPRKRRSRTRPVTSGPLVIAGGDTRSRPEDLVLNTQRRSMTNSTGITLISGHPLQAYPSTPPRRRNSRVESPPGTLGTLVSQSQGDNWARRRRHSDTPIIYSPTLAVHATGVQGTTDGLAFTGGRKGPVHRASEQDISRHSGGSLHPYLVNWTSPIDLLGGLTSPSLPTGGSHTHSSRMV